MKNINQWIQTWGATDDKTFYELLKAVQEDAYNQAIEDAAEAATVEELDLPRFSYYQVDKQSILDLKIKGNETKSNGD